MFRKNKPAPAPTVPAERINAIASRIPPIDYCDAGSRGRRPSRSATFKQAMVRTPGGDEVPVVIKNMSSSGLRVEYFQSCTLGDRVLIVEPSLPLHAWAQVVWQAEGASGLQLERDDKE
jgi:hypothetical protein